MTTRVSIAPRDQLPELLYQLEQYFRDLSEYTPSLFDGDMPFTYRGLDSYWTQEFRHPFLFVCDSNVAGFALVQELSHRVPTEHVNDIAEFYVAKPYRRRGVGRLAAHDIFGRFPGQWEVRVRCCNAVAMAFWETVVCEFTDNHYETAAWTEDQSLWRVLLFRSHGTTSHT